jgi:hypothetical protein
VDDVSSPAVASNNISNINDLRFYHEIRGNLKVFTPLQSGDLEEALKADSTCELYEELRADARAALVQENPRRAVLEIAISCEVVTICVHLRQLCCREPAGWALTPILRHDLFPLAFHEAESGQSM